MWGETAGIVDHWGCRNLVLQIVLGIYEGNLFKDL